jgi:tRNA(Ile)-lysidine synthase
MVMLDAVTRVGAESGTRLIVATFDHGTGQSAADAVDLVREAARERSLDFVTGRMQSAAASASSEEVWRAARWKFLHECATRDGGGSLSHIICTAHTRDDQVETVLMRALRDAGPRGLAGLEAPSRVTRPLLQCTRSDILTYARAVNLGWVEDPTNASRRYLRNRVRHELLPAASRVRPWLGRELLEIGREAGQWRRDLDALVDQAIATRVHPLGVDVALADLACHPSDAAAILWSAAVARAGLVMDRRGTARVKALIANGRTGASIQLSGNWELTRRREWLELRRPLVEPVAANLQATAGV